jgi:hypothetical protein
MRGQCSLLTIFAFSGLTLAQAPAPIPADSNPLLTAPPGTSAPTTTSSDLFASGDSTNAGPAGTRGFSNFIGFIGNPLQNIDPRAVTEIYPIFINAWIPSFGPLPSSVSQLYGAGITVALSDRLSMGLNQGGFADVHLRREDFPRLAAMDPTGRFSNIEIGGSRSGWLNLGGFFQYTLIANEESQFLFTGGLRYEVPCGSYELFQGHGPVHLAPYFTFGKEFGHFHVLGTMGYLFPAGPGSDTSNLFYSNIHIDRQCFGWFYPLVEINTSYTIKSVSFDLPTRRGFFDFGGFESSGNIVVLSAGANAVIQRDRLELGAVYFTPIASQHGFDCNGLLVRLNIRF